MRARGRDLWIGRNWSVLLGCALVVAGIALALTAPSVATGWFAFQPKADVVFVPPPQMTPQWVLGYAVILAGIVWLTAVIAFRIGKRARS